MENVAIFDSPGKGRGLKTTKELWAGDVIFSEASLAAVVFDRYCGDVKCGRGRDKDICAVEHYLVNHFFLESYVLPTISYVVLL